MTTSTYTTSTSYADPKTISVEKQIDQISQKSCLEFKKIQKFYLKFHSCFLFGIILELFAFGFLFHYFPKSSVLALFISGIFLTIFSHVVLLSYFQVKKPQQFAQIKEDFVKNCQRLLQSAPGTSAYHFSFSNALHHLVCKLTISEAIAQEWIKKSEIYSHLIFKWRLWTQWKDLLKMKELLLTTAVEEHFALIKLEPTDLEAHASLANSYRIFSKIYLDPQKLTMNEYVTWMPRRYYSEELASKSTQLLQKALQELLILQEYAVNDPWVHTQLATLYEELKMPDQEIKEYEKILTISPEEKEIIYRLGLCYFLQGANAKGLRMYSLLKSLNPTKAAELIDYYDGYK